MKRYMHINTSQSIYMYIHTYLYLYVSLQYIFKWQNTDFRKIIYWIKNKQYKSLQKKKKLKTAAIEKERKNYSIAAIEVDDVNDNNDCI